MTAAEFIREYEAASRAHELERTLSLIDDDAIYWFSDGTSHVGKAAIERAIRNNFETIKDGDFAITDIVWVIESADVAACTYRFTWSGLVHGTPASGSGRGTSVLSRRGDSWVVVHEHLSKEKPAN